MAVHIIPRVLINDKKQIDSINTSDFFSKQALIAIKKNVSNIISGDTITDCERSVGSNKITKETKKVTFSEKKSFDNFCT